MKLLAFNIVSSFSIALPLVSLYKRRLTVPADYMPFVILIILGALNEFLSLVMIRQFRNNMLNSNIFVLVEYILLILQFRAWRKWLSSKTIVLLVAGIALWTADNLLLHQLTSDNSLFRLGYSITIALLAIEQISSILVSDMSKLQRQPVFLLCLSFVLYYSFKSCYESFNLIEAGVDTRFFEWLWLFLNFFNLAGNIIYAYAIIWMKKKKPFTLAY